MFNAPYKRLWLILPLFLSSLVKGTLLPGDPGFNSDHHHHHHHHEVNDQESRTSRQSVDFRDAYDDPATGLKCVDKTETVRTQEKERLLECVHSVINVCHYTYVTKFKSQRVEECSDNYEKICSIIFRSVAENETVQHCYTPVEKSCENTDDSNVVCQTVFESECSTRYVEKKSSKKFVGLTACKKIPIELCGTDCKFVTGEERCHNKTVAVLSDIPEENCELVPQESCRGVYKLVPYLTPQSECKDVPREICSYGVKSNRLGEKPLVTKWCYDPKDEEPVVSQRDPITEKPLDTFLEESRGGLDEKPLEKNRQIPFSSDYEDFSLPLFVSNDVVVNDNGKEEEQIFTTGRSIFFEPLTTRSDLNKISTTADSLDFDDFITTTTTTTTTITTTTTFTTTTTTTTSTTVVTTSSTSASTTFSSIFGAVFGTASADINELPRTLPPNVDEESLKQFDDFLKEYEANYENDDEQEYNYVYKDDIFYEIQDGQPKGQVSKGEKTFLTATTKRESKVTTPIPNIQPREPRQKTSLVFRDNVPEDLESTILDVVRPEEHNKLKIAQVLGPQRQDVTKEALARVIKHKDKPIGQTIIIKNTPEALKLFGVKNIPKEFLIGQRKKIEDTLNSNGTLSSSSFSDLLKAVTSNFTQFSDEFESNGGKLEDMPHVHFTTTTTTNTTIASTTTTTIKDAGTSKMIARERTDSQFTSISQLFPLSSLTTSTISPITSTSFSEPIIRLKSTPEIVKMTGTRRPKTVTFVRNPSITAIQDFAAPDKPSTASSFTTTATSSAKQILQLGYQNTIKKHQSIFQRKNVTKLSSNENFRPPPTLIYGFKPMTSPLPFPITTTTTSTIRPSPTSRFSAPTSLHFGFKPMRDSNHNRSPRRTRRQNESVIGVIREMLSPFKKIINPSG